MAVLGQSIAGSTLQITATAPANDDAAGWAAIADFTNVGEITNYSVFGDVYTPVTYITVEDRREKLIKGSVTAGTQTITLADVPADAGQVILDAALDSDADYYFAETWQDGSVFYYMAKVMSMSGQGGDANAVRQSTVDLAINSKPIFVAA